jgi:uncharacterized protein
VRVFADANVLFAAAISPAGRSAALFLLAARKACTLITSTHAVTEARRNIESRYPKAQDRFEELFRTVRVVPEALSSRALHAHQHGLPDEDAPILAAATEASAAVLVTGDRTHFGHLFGRAIDGVRVLTLAQTHKPPARTIRSEPRNCHEIPLTGGAV